MTSRCTCRHCTPQATEPEQAPTFHKPVILPTKPRRFRIHHDGRTQDCTLHPDGRLTMTAAGQLWVSALSFDEMRDRNWATAHVEWDPAEESPEPPKPVPQPDAVQAELTPAP
ncbi:hypothetical protein [Streptomyces pacificus]|uniref:Uncharacterized protein n=1 Tax=Streptomyces pacificus TaxID=2705029 RepID=A0A6A0ANW7_9ACTN|nr:hypothetical protein [Streptomyces pacificus]GFH34328.1 hypothetical protein SCWH03_05420 [Streptomyces pacificus]